MRKRFGTWTLMQAAGVCVGLAMPVLGQEAAPPTGGDDEIAISAFSEPVELIEIVRFVAGELGISIQTQGAIAGQVAFNTERTIHRRDLLPLLERLLDQHNYALTYDEVTDFYTIRPTASAGGVGDGEFSTTRIIPTPNVRPTGLREAVEVWIGSGSGLNLAYVDEIGAIVATGSPLRLRELEKHIGRLLEEHRQLDVIEIQLKHLAAVAARDRAIEFVAGGNQRQLQFNLPGQNNGQNNQDNRPVGTLDNLADRLIVSPQSNSLFFRGRPEEVEWVREILGYIDQPSTLEPREFFAGNSAARVADIAQQRGLGEVVRLSEDDTQSANSFRNIGGNQLQNRLRNNTQNQQTGGSVMVVDEEHGKIIYYGTPEQQVEFAKLVKELKAEGDRIVIERYKLQNAKAEDVAVLLQSLVDSASPTTDAPLLPGGARSTARPVANIIDPNAPAGDDAFTADPDRVYVDFFEAQNTVLVKAPQRMQEQFARLIDSLDERRPQVYLTAQIVAVSDTDAFRFAVENQLINAGGTGGALQTNFGLTSQDGTFVDPRDVGTGLSGLTAALIRSDYVPFVINALKTETDARIISSPQLLVDDNVQASIVSVEEEPTTSQSQGDGGIITTFDGFQEAGTQLTVTPSISSGGYVRLNYEIELSNFVGTGANGIPPPKQTRNVSAESVTVPGDTTIVVGGIVVKDDRKTTARVPFFGKIPLIGPLFGDTNKNNEDSVLYVFITPQIMTDPNFADLRLLTEGPQARVRLDPDLPELEPAVMEAINSALRQANVPAADWSAPVHTGGANPPPDDGPRMMEVVDN